MALTNPAVLLRDAGEWTANQTVIDSWGLPSKTPAQLGLNRVATSVGSAIWTKHPAFTGRKNVLERLRQVILWQADDNESEWYPQGITTHYDAVGGPALAGKKWVVTSAYHDESDTKGARVTFVDTTTPTSATYNYRHVLLVEPTAPNSFRRVPIHAGGLAWYGKYLYVATTSVGFLVFDTTQMKQVSTDDKTKIGRVGTKYYGLGYEYVLPLVGRYVMAGTKMKFSYCAIDRGQTPHRILAGEYDTSAHAQLRWWNLDAATGRLAMNGGLAAPVLERGTGADERIQGAVSWNSASPTSNVWLCSSELSEGELFRRPRDGGPGKSYNSWALSGEDLSYDADAGLLWSLTEDDGKRSIFAVRIADV